MSSLNTAEQDKTTPGDLLKLEFIQHKVLPTCIVRESNLQAIYVNMSLL